MGLVLINARIIAPISIDTTPFIFKGCEDWKCDKASNGKEVNANPEIWIVCANRTDYGQECFHIEIMVNQKAAFYARIDKLVNIDRGLSLANHMDNWQDNWS